MATDLVTQFDPIPCKIEGTQVNIGRELILGVAEKDEDMILNTVVNNTTMTTHDNTVEEINEREKQRGNGLELAIRAKNLNWRCFK